MTQYPLATGDDVHYSTFHGAVLVALPPRKFLDMCPSMQIDEEDDYYINAFVEHINDGCPLDACELGLNNQHDGRHRAAAALLAGCETIPVNVDPKLAEFFEWPRWE